MKASQLTVKALLALAMASSVACSNSGYRSAAGSQALGLESNNSGMAMMSLSTIGGFSDSSITLTNFTLNFDAVPNQDKEDLVIGLSQKAAAAYTDLAAVVRFNTAGAIDVRNASTYTALSTVSYSSRSSYHFRMIVDVSSHSYSVFVTAPGKSEVQIAKNYAFRSEQSGVTSLGNLGMYGLVGSASLSNISLSLSLPNMGVTASGGVVSTGSSAASGTVVNSGSSAAAGAVVSSGSSAASSPVVSTGSSAAAVVVSTSGFPNASNTGVPAGTALKASGDINVTKDNAVIDAVEVTGCISVNANNVIIKNSRVLGGGCYEPIHIAEGYSGLVVQDTEIDGQRSAMCGEAIGVQGYTLIRVNAHGCSDGPRLAGSLSITIKDSYIHDLSNLPGDHGDGMQAYGLNLAAGQVVSIIHNTIEGGTNAAIFTADGATGDLLIDSNLLMGPNYPLKLYDNRATVRNNLIFDNTGNYYAGYYGPLATFFGGSGDPGLTIVEWTNNHLTSTRDGSVVGALIAQPTK